MEIRLSTTSTQPDAEVAYDFLTGHFHLIHPGDPLIHLFTAPSRIIHREEYELRRLEEAGKEEEEDEDGKEEEEEKKEW